MSRVNVKFMKVSKNILCTGLNEVDTENEGRFTIDSNYQIKCNYFDETSSNNKITMTNGGRLLTTNGMFVEGFEEDYPLTQAIYSSIYVCTVSGGTVGSQITNLPYPATDSSYALVVELNPNLTFTAVNGAEISWSQQSSIIVSDISLDTTNKRVIIRFNINTSSTPRMFNNGSISATLYEISYTDKSGKSIFKPSEILPATNISYMHEYTYTTGTLPTGVGSITANRSQSVHSPEGTSTGTIASGTKIYAGDKLYFSATAATGYGAPTVQYNSSSNALTVSGNVTGSSYVTGAGVSTYAVTISAGTGVSSVYLSTSSTATSGSASGTKFNYNSTVYGFAKLSAGFNAASGWTLVSGTANSANAIYRVGSKIVTSAQAFGTMTAVRKTFTYSTGTLPTGVASITAYRALYSSTSSYSVISNGTTINYGDRMYFAATAATGYDAPTVSKNSSSNYLTVSGNVTGSSYVTGAGQTAYNVTITAGTGIASANISMLNDPIGSVGSSAEVEHGATAYPCIQITDDAYNPPSGWTLATTPSGQSGRFYMGAGVQITSNYNFGTINAVRKTFTYTTGTLPTGVASITAKRAAWNATSSYSDIANNTTITYGDRIYFTATAATGYNNPTVSKNSTSNYLTVSGNVTGSSYVTAGSKKSYTLTITKGNGISTIYYKLGSGSWTTWTSGTVSVSHGTAVYCYATPSTGYSYSYNSTSNYYTVSSSATGNLTFSATGTINTYAVTIAAGTGVSSVYLSTTSNATSGSASGTKFNYNATVYGFAKLAAGFNAGSGWTLISGTANSTGAIYRVGSKTVGTSGAAFGTITATRKTFTYSTGTLPTGVASITAYRALYSSTSSYSVIPSGTTINYGDRIYFTATAASGYNAPTVSKNSSSNYITVSGNVTGSSYVTAGSQITITLDPPQVAVPDGVEHIISQDVLMFEVYNPNDVDIYIDWDIENEMGAYWRASNTTLIEAASSLIIEFDELTNADLSQLSDTEFILTVRVWNDAQTAFIDNLTITESFYPIIHPSTYQG